MKTRALLAVICTVFLIVVPVALAASTTITMSGSTSVAPLAVQLAKAYNKKTGGKVKFKIAQGGSDVGVADAARGRVTIGNSSRDPKPADPGGIVFNKIARDALCVVTNSKNVLANLTQQQVIDIYTGKVRNWSDVSGASLSGPIDLIVRTPASGTQDAFDNIFLALRKPSSSASTKSSNGLVAQAVKSNSNAIGYVSAAFVTAGIHVVPYKGVACSLRNAKAGRYEGARNLWMVTRGSAKGEAKKFITWIRTSSQARKIVTTEWVPLR